MEKTAEIYTTRSKQQYWSETAYSGKLVDNYRFGFNGQEKDDEITGVTGSHLNFKYRMYDSRIGRFFTVDPLTSKYPYNSPYAFCENKLGLGIELEGLEVYYLNTEWGSMAGMGEYGYGYVSGNGVANDDIGRTFFSYESKISLSDKESVAGIQAFYKKTHIGVDLSSRTFEESIKKSPVTSVDANPVFGGSIDIRDYDTYLGFSIGLGLGVAHSTIETEITESFSMTKEDIGNVMKNVLYISNEDTPEYYRYAKDGQDYLGYKLPKSLFGLGIFDMSTNIESDIKIYNVSQDKEMQRWQTEAYQDKLQNLK